MIYLFDSQGRSAEEAVRSKLHEILESLQQTGPVIRESLLSTVRAHFQSRFPGSKHYDPQKVVEKSAQNGEQPSGEIEIDVPGVTRAYHDVTLTPKFHQHLAIPIHRQAYGKSPKDFSGLVTVTKKDGSKLMAQKADGGLVFLYALKKRVFQPQDSSIMPSDQTLADGIFDRLHAYLESAAH